MVRYRPNTPPEEQDIDNIQILTLQGHPEYLEGIVTRIVAVRKQAGIIDAATAADAERRRFWKHDGVNVLGKTIWAVLGIYA